MGLDTVELAIRIEETFNIKIADQDAPELITVGQIYDYVLERVTFGRPSRCLTAAAFYQLRRALARDVQVSRDRVRPSVKLDALFVRDGRTRHWSELAQTLDWQLPDLHRPRWMVDTIMLGIAGTFLIGFLGSAFLSPLNGSMGLAGSVLFSIVCTAALSVLAMRVTEPFAIEFAEDCETVGGLVRSLAQMNQGKVAGGVGTPAEVWETLCFLVSSQAGVPREVILETTTLVNDLGMD